jgi:hypothetical protein
VIDVSSRLVPQLVIDLKPIASLGRLGGRCQSGSMGSRSAWRLNDSARVPDVRDALSRAGNARDSSWRGVARRSLCLGMPTLDSGNMPRAPAVTSTNVTTWWLIVECEDET